MPTYPSGEHGDHIVRNDLIRMVYRHEATRERSMQVDIGPSQVGTACDRSLAFQTWVADGNIPNPEQDAAAAVLKYNPASDPFPSIVGTAVHAWLEGAAQKDNLIERTMDPTRHTDRWLTEAVVDIEHDGHTISGHVDLIDLWHNMVIDFKVLGAASHRKVSDGGTPQYRTQIQLYGLGVEQTLGIIPKQVSLALLPRNGPLRNLTLVTWDYDPDYAREAMERLVSVTEIQRSGTWQSLDPSPSDDNCRWCSVPLTECPEGIIFR
jgi:hypothetical protein